MAKSFGEIVKEYVEALVIAFILAFFIRLL